MKKIGSIEPTTLSASRPNSKSLRTTVPREVVSLLDLNVKDRIEWIKVIDKDGNYGEKGQIMAVVRKKINRSSENVGAI